MAAPTFMEEIQRHGEEEDENAKFYARVMEIVELIQKYQMYISYLFVILYISFAIRIVIAICVRWWLGWKAPKWLLNTDLSFKEFLITLVRGKKSQRGQGRVRGEPDHPVINHDQIADKCPYTMQKS